jgi:pimeloyl-ACP methyl ester carboxylesterase
MPTFSAHDGTRLSYRVSGDGAPLICVPGGPMRDSTSPRARLVVQPGAGHFPWLDDAERFVATTSAFLR